MSNLARNVAVLGSTGSIGRSTLEVIDGSQGRLVAQALSAHRQLERLCEQACRHRPRWIVASDPVAADQQRWDRLPGNVQLLVGQDALCQIVQQAEIDVVVAGIVGSAGLASTWAAIEAGKTIALANKETLVVAGPQVIQHARRHQAAILPVDSEHSALFQCLQAGRQADVKRVILTASGGPFRDFTRQQLRDVTVQQALAHPTWDMGPKITVDSATMMNKALEIIEARWLFDLRPQQIDVVVHPQSIVHSLVEFQDGSLIAQLSCPDMRLPIQYALTYPERWPGSIQKLDWSQTLQLDFLPADPQRFPALELGHEVARQGGTTGAVVNAANEAAVGRFLQKQLAFDQIVPACRAVLEAHHFDPNPTLDALLKLDRWAREEIARWACT